jgi:hypothetical protein
MTRTAITLGRDYRRRLARDCAALTWTIDALGDGKELESFIEGIPDLVAADDENAHYH